MKIVSKLFGKFKIFFVYLQYQTKTKIDMNVNKELVKEIIETDELDERMNKFYDLVNELMAENTVRDLAECAAEHIVHNMAVPRISVTLTQFEEIERMFKIKGQDGRGGDRRSKKFKSLKDEEIQKALELLNSKK